MAREADAMTPTEAGELSALLVETYGADDVMRTLRNWPHEAMDEAVRWWIGAHPEESPQATPLIERMQERARAQASEQGATSHASRAPTYYERPRVRGSRRRAVMAGRIVIGLAHGNAEARRELARLNLATLNDAEMTEWVVRAVRARAEAQTDASEADVMLMVASALDDLPSMDDDWEWA
jgi:hypothetical protein